MDQQSADATIINSRIQGKKDPLKIKLEAISL